MTPTTRPRANKDTSAPASLLQFRQALSLLERDETRRQGLRLTIDAALRQNNAHRALQAGAELTSRSDCTNDDFALHAKALLYAGRNSEALKVLEKSGNSEEALRVAAQTHILLGNTAAARKAAAEAVKRPGLKKRDRQQLEWLENYAAALMGEKAVRPLGARWAAAEPVVRDVPIIALFDYKSPHRKRNSLNIGDWMQTLAAMRHLARLDGVEWTYDDPRLAQLMKRLRATWPDTDRKAVSGRAHLAIMDRDFPLSASLRFPGRKVWALANGWYSHKLFGTTRAWPMPDGLMPLLVSVHISHASDLSADRLDWLASHAPIGCRDHATLTWLRNQGIDAYLSGCMTMTLATAKNKRSNEDLWVDLDGDHPGGIALTHHDEQMRRSHFVASMRTAADLLDRYAASNSVHTSRLHCALPARAVGANVEFVAGVASDPRFDGLTNLNDAAFKQRADALSDLMADVLPDIIQQEPLSAIRKKILHHAGITGPRPTRRQLHTPAPKQGRRPEEATIAVAYDSNYIDMARTVLKSVRTHTKLRLRVVMLTRGVTDDDARSAAAVADPFDVRVFQMDEELSGITVDLLQDITISTMDRLYLAKLLPDLDKIIYIDCDTLVRGDIAELARYETGPAGIAARIVPRGKNVASALERRARTMSCDAASALRDWAAENSNLAAPMFNAGVLALSLDKIRDLGIDDQALDLVHRYGLHDQDALNLVAAGRTGALPIDWNTIANVDHCTDPMLIHWNGRAKPWSKAPVPLKDEWRNAAAAANSKIDKTHWTDPSSFVPGWDRRAELAAPWFPTSGRIADIGCGAPMALRGFLSPDVEYVPADLTAWTKEVIEIDLDKLEFPAGKFAAVAMLGVLEYLEQPGRVLLLARRRTDQLIVSYCHPVAGSGTQLRAKRGWINSHRQFKFPTFLKRFGWAIEDQKTFNENDQFRQIIYRCAACERERPPSIGPLATKVREERLTYLNPNKIARIETAIKRVIDANVPGDFAEFGVALGGSAIIIADQAMQDDRRFIGLDVFDMIPPPTSPHDDEVSRQRYETISKGQSKGIGEDLYYGYHSDLLKEVTQSFTRHGLAPDSERIVLAPGLFEESWPAFAGRPLAFAHIDCDWFDPVSYCLQAVKADLSPGGIMVIDDYHSYGGARVAVDEFLSRNKDFVFEDGHNPLLIKAS